MKEENCKGRRRDTKREGRYEIKKRLDKGEMQNEGKTKYRNCRRERMQNGAGDADKKRGRR